MTRKEMEELIKRELGNDYSLRQPRLSGGATFADTNRGKKKRPKVDAVAPAVSKTRGKAPPADSRRSGTSASPGKGIAIVEVEKKSSKDNATKDRRTVVVSLRTGKILGERG